MPRARKPRISTKPVFSENGGGTERDEKFTLKYNKTISSTNSYGTINCVVYDTECKGNLALTTIPHVITSAGNRHGWHLFHLIGPLPQAGMYHGLLQTFHLHICKMMVCHTFLLGNPRVEVGYKGVGRGLNITYFFFLSFLSLFFHSLSLFPSFYSLSQETKSSIETHLKIMNLYFLCHLL